MRTDESDKLDRVHHGLLLARWARLRRAELGLTQEQVADRMGIGVDTGWVTQLENGQKKTMILQPWLGLLAKALNSSEIELLKESGVITEPLPEPGAPVQLFKEGDVRAAIVEVLQRIDPHDPRYADKLVFVEDILEGYAREQERG